MSFKIDIESVLNGLSEFEMKSKAAIGVYADTAGKKLEEHAKKNAPWTDRTGLARKTIEGGKEWDSEKCIVYVAGNMEYSPYLELCNDKRYATLKPAVDKLSPEILNGLNKILEK
ncbi:hypothetical protein ACIR03_02725 [Clostridium cochlearium]|uniref:hypothetical protein n=1 Tax=Clostridium cochlearium TaxID=1494 RepID=UPI001570F8BD|nr:hypothetical protein [Clostridium cochlearium]MBV1816857.1 hypothetical protein [Bacteroidales bacterium MSK.15.36]MCG4571778.1 hypothetical protein [Clostridium cochlearium]MCG4579107.1 hypothetical protein [Clostridium cochlearium]NSJ90136.1 hypothetical protein [Coprococcus sp. MSK.21.13]